MSTAVPPRQRQFGLFLLGALPCLLLALYTRHGWEDWYITFRAAKNLAMGYGLVFDHGLRLQTFTSPINAVLPAALSWITGNNNDDLALWLYRFVGAALLGGTVLNLDRLARLQGLARPALWFMVAFFLIDFKIADFTINGQEAAFLVFFVSLILVALLERRTFLLGVAWAGMMWSRPDGFVYIGGTCLGYTLALALGERTALRATFRRFFHASLLTVVFYGPWFAWATWYYGSPIPHSAVAKGLHNGNHTVLDAVLHLSIFPAQGLLNFKSTTYNFLFMPTNYDFGGWPAALTVFGRLLGLLASLAWLLPRASVLLRTSSLGCLIGLFYLNYFAPFPCAWYFPPCILLAIVTLAALLQHVLDELPEQKTAQHIAIGLAGVTVLIWFLATLAMSWETKVQQTLIETGQRKNIGLWLKSHAAGPHDTVFLECLGYIGFYSNLKMYDYPGMSSPEVVAARSAYGENWVALIGALRPDWLVLRRHELNMLEQVVPNLQHFYRQEADFNQSAAVAAVRFLPGRPYLEYDQEFLILHRIASGPH
jgi:hypothetical protein